MPREPASMTLTIEDIAVLKAMDGAAPDDAVFSNIPQRLFVYGLISRQPSGEVILTKSGSRRLFQQACCDALRAVAEGAALAPESDTGRWLGSSGFVARDAASGASSVTRRGQVWLDSFEADAPRDAAAPQAADFAGRRDNAA